MDHVTCPVCGEGVDTIDLCAHDQPVCDRCCWPEHMPDVVSTTTNRLAYP